MHQTFSKLYILGLAKRVRGRVLIASTSEVYGDPKKHPQPETYWGHVNPIGNNFKPLLICFIKTISD